MRKRRGRASGATLRGPWASAWLRIRRDRWTVAALVALAIVIVVSLYAILDPRAGRETARGREKPLVGGVF